MILEWMKRWGIPYEAVLDLQQRLGAVSDVQGGASTPESEVQTAIRLEASKKGLRLWRNNVGATYTTEGSFLRYGLCNDSKRMNEHIKSSDLIGIRPVMIGGQLIGQFVAREVKAGDWKYKGTKREEAQLRFLELVTSMGGDAAFTTKEGLL